MCSSRPTAITSRNTGCRTASCFSLATRGVAVAQFIRSHCKENCNGPRQTWCHITRQAQKISESRQGILRAPQEHDPHRQAGGGEGKPICLPRSQKAQAHL